MPQSLAQPAGIELTPELRSTLTHYLGKDCSVEEEPTALEHVLKLSATQVNVVVPILRQTLLNSPDKTLIDIDAIRKSLAEEWQRRKESLERGAVKGLSEQHVRVLTDIKRRDEYVNAGVKSFQSRIWQRSYVALKRIDTREARLAIAEVRKTGSDEVKALIALIDHPTGTAAAASPTR
jgi:hypothetical protein